MRRMRSRLLLALIVFAAPGLATLALAQPRKPTTGGAGKPKPAAVVKPDAAPAMVPDDDAGHPAASDVPPPPPADIGDGGRSSPLNPQPAELPSNAVDAGVPVDYDRLLADIAALRARVAAVADNLYQSRIAVSVQTDNPKAKIAKLTVSLDDGVVYNAPPTFSASDLTVLYDHAVAPGKHALTIDVERKDSRDESFRTGQRSRFTVDVPRDNRLDVQVKISDDSSMGGDFPADKSGKYDLRFRVKAVAKPVGK